ncbi:glycosyltransferase [Nocardioides cynanchi]|uniref:glycosyltransferase n=1 Tax=Nocardioides cynanchi TaxID=2558918 RepID=UPI0012448586|nr:glycosyltransferase [Nocardioides cynanchi]
MTAAVDVLYVSSVATPAEFARMREQLRPGAQEVTYGMPDAGFKFHSLIQQGLLAQGCRIHAIVGRSASHRFHLGRWWPRRREVVSDRLTVDHLAFPNLPVLKQVWLALGLARQTLAWRWRTRRAATRVMIIDGAYVSAMATVLPSLRGASHLTRIGIFADLYSYMADVHDASGRRVGPVHSAARRSVATSLSMLDGYVVLTEQMAEVLGTDGKPYVVMEGLVDVEASAPAPEGTEKASHPTVLYAGALRKEYGVESLVRGFQAWDRPDAELVVFGQGDYAAELAAIAAVDPRITYRGVVPTAEVVAAERTAWLLVNPRPAEEEFTKYSFPSKNMEYLVSGTAVLTTRLPGMPVEYLEHVLTIDEPGPDGVSRGLEKAFAEGFDALLRRGEHGRAFVLEHKNNVRQASRILSLSRRPAR